MCTFPFKECFSINRYLLFAITVILQIECNSFPLQKIDNTSEPSPSPYLLLKRDFNHLSVFEISQLDTSFFYTLPAALRRTIPNETYWLVLLYENKTHKPIMMEFAPVMESIVLYVERDGLITDSLKYSKNIFVFSNDVPSTDPFFLLPQYEKAKFYIKLKSPVSTGLGMRLNPVDKSIGEIISKHIYYCVFISIILVLLLYNAVFYLRLRDKAYLWYFALLASMLIYFLNISHYIFPIYKNIEFSYSLYTLAFMSITVCYLCYVRAVVRQHPNFKKWDKVILIAVFLRIILFILGTVTGNLIFHHELIDTCLLLFTISPLYSSYISGNKVALIMLISVIIVNGGYAIFTIASIYKQYFFSLSPSFKLIQIKHYTWLADMILISFTLTERYNQVRKEKESALRSQLDMNNLLLAKTSENLVLKEKLASKLEKEVEARTLELVNANRILKSQSDEIEQLNQLLNADNERLRKDLENLSKARIMESNVSFEEFLLQFPSDKACIGLVAGLKWEHGYKCRKCGYKKYYEDSQNLSRRCKACNHSESATAFTILEGTKFSLQKSLYIAYRYFHNNKIVASSLAKEIDLRENTCRNFISRIKQETKPKVLDWVELLRVVK